MAKHRRKHKRRPRRKYSWRHINWHGHPPLPIYRIALRRRLAWVLNRHPNVYVTATTDGVHAAGSYHYQKRAVDLGSDDPQNEPEKKAFADLAARWHSWAELFGPLGFYIKNGVRYSGMFPGHGDHTHLAK